MQIIKASEIGEFYYCCLAWFLRRKGIKPKISEEARQKLEKGIKRHEEVGKQIVNVEQQKIQANFFKYIGYGILVFVVILIIFFLLK
jgi:hypothetical protein